MRVIFLTTALLFVAVSAYSQITLTSPNGGESWEVGSQHNITWTDNGLWVVSLWYSASGGSSWYQIASWIANTQSYTWIVPNTPSTTCRIKVADAANNNVYDISDNNFTITSETNVAAQSPTLASPSDNSYINDNTPQLSWSVPIDGNGDQLHFKVEIDGDHNWSNISRVIESKSITTGFSPTPPVNQGTGSMNYVVQTALSEGDWWWRVAAWDGHVYGSYSAERKFAVDITKPYTSNHNPAKNASGVAINSNILINVQDVLSGVKQSSIIMKVNGNTVSPIITGATSNCTLTYNPTSDFNYNQTVSVSIDAEDNAGNKMNTDSYIFITTGDQTAPEINHSAVATANSGQSITILAILTDNIGIQQATLYYRQGGKVNYTAIVMNNTSGNNYHGIIPDDDVTERGLEYYILVEDASNNFSTFPEVNAATNPQLIRVRISNFSNPNATAADAYRMISIPLDLDNPSPHDVLEKNENWGRYNNREWRLLRWEKDKYLEYTRDDSFDNFEPGKGFWIITKDEKILQAGSGLTVPVGENFPITLQPGWNQIGNPFTFSVDWEDVIRDRNKVEDNLYGYYGERNEEEGYRNATCLVPWEGYFIKNRDPINTTIIEIPPIEAPGQLSRRFSNLLSLYSFQNEEWGLQIIAECGRYIDVSNYIGSLRDAHNEWDLHDFSEPPFFCEYVSLYFLHENWINYPGLYSGDFRPATLEGGYWDFCVKTNVLNSEINLNLENIQNLPSDWSILLLDKTSQLTIDLLGQKKYTFFLNRAEVVHEFRIFVGAENFIDKNNLEITEIPERYKLTQNYPNPFNSATQIKYFLPISGWVNLSVYSIIGQKIATLVNSYQGAGSYILSWDGRTENGNIVSSGIYLIKMESGRFIKTQKMILAK